MAFFMANSPDIIVESADLLRKNFELPQLDGEKLDREELVQFLARVVTHLLNKDFEQLLRICYRIDLAEEKLKWILHHSPPERIALDLSEAIVDRQIQKVEIRRKYR